MALIVQPYLRKTKSPTLPDVRAQAPGGAEAYGAGVYQAQGQLAAGMDNLAKAQLQIEEERQAANVIKATNELTGDLSPRLDYYSSLEFEGAQGSSEAYTKELHSKREEIIRKYGFTGKALAAFDNQTSNFARISTGAINRNQIVQQKKQDELSFNMANLKDAELVVKDGDPVENMVNLYMGIKNRAIASFGSDGETAVKARILESNQTHFKGVYNTLISQGRYKEAQEVIEISKHLLPETFLAGYRAKTEKFVEADELENLAQKIQVASNGDFELSMKMAEESGSGNVAGLKKRISELDDTEKKYKKKEVDGRIGGFFDWLVANKGKVNLQKAQAVLGSLVTGKDYIQANNSLESWFDDSVKTNDLETIFSFNEMLQKGQLTKEAIFAATGLTNSKKEEYANKIFNGAYKLTEEQERNLQYGINILTQRIEDSTERKIAIDLLSEGGKQYKNTNEVIASAKVILENKLYKKDNYLPAIQNRAVLEEALDGFYGRDTRKALGGFAADFGRNVSNWDAEKNLKATTSLLEKTYATLNTDGIENPQDFYQVKIQEFMEELGEYAPGERPQDEREFLRLWEGFLNIRSKQIGQNLYRPLPQNNPAPPTRPQSAMLSESDISPAFELKGDY